MGRGAQVEAQHLHVPGHRVVPRLLRVPDGGGDAVRRPHHGLGVRLLGLGRHQLIRLRANMRAGPGRGVRGRPQTTTRNDSFQQPKRFCWHRLQRESE